MAESEIDRIRALLVAKARPVGWAERRQRIEEIGAYWPPSPDIAFEQADLGNGVTGHLRLWIKSRRWIASSLRSSR